MPKFLLFLKMSPARKIFLLKKKMVALEMMQKAAHESYNSEDNKQDIRVIAMQKIKHLVIMARHYHEMKQAIKEDKERMDKQIKWLHENSIVVLLKPAPDQLN